MFTPRRRRESIVIGPELVTNGNFAGGATGWTVSNADGTHIATFAGGTLRYQSDTTSPQLIVAQTGILTIGKTYRVSVTVSAWASGTLGVYAGSTNQFPVNSVGTFSGTLVCTGNTNFLFTRNSSNVDITMSNVSVVQVGP